MSRAGPPEPDTRTPARAQRSSSVHTPVDGGSCVGYCRVVRTCLHDVQQKPDALSAQRLTRHVNLANRIPAPHNRRAAEPSIGGVHFGCAAGGMVAQGRGARFASANPRIGGAGGDWVTACLRQRDCETARLREGEPTGKQGVGEAAPARDGTEQFAWRAHVGVGERQQQFGGLARQGCKQDETRQEEERRSRAGRQTPRPGGGRRRWWRRRRRRARRGEGGRTHVRGWKRRRGAEAPRTPRQRPRPAAPPARVARRGSRSRGTRHRRRRGVGPAAVPR